MRDLSRPTKTLDPGSAMSSCSMVSARWSWDIQRQMLLCEASSRCHYQVDREAGAEVILGDVEGFAFGTAGRGASPRLRESYITKTATPQPGSKNGTCSSFSVHQDPSFSHPA